LQGAEMSLARPVNPTVMRVAAQPKVFVIGSEHDLG
jgi:hypothetical protein